MAVVLLAEASRMSHVLIPSLKIRALREGLAGLSLACRSCSRGSAFCHRQPPPQRILAAQYPHGQLPPLTPIDLQKADPMPLSNCPHRSLTSDNVRRPHSGLRLFFEECEAHTRTSSVIHRAVPRVRFCRSYLSPPPCRTGAPPACFRAW
jgi:hypothetical protein